MSKLACFSIEPEWIIMNSLTNYTQNLDQHINLNSRDFTPVYIQ